MHIVTETFACYFCSPISVMVCRIKKIKNKYKKNGHTYKFPLGLCEHGNHVYVTLS